MSSLRFLSRVLPLTLLMSMPAHGATDLERMPSRAAPDIDMQQALRGMPPALTESSERKMAPMEEPARPTRDDERPAAKKSEYSTYVKEIKNKRELKEALKSHKNIALKISTDWCGACHMCEEPFAQAVKSQRSNVKAYTLNADKPEFKEFLEMLNVPGYPTFVYIRTEVGAREGKEFKKALADLTGATRITESYEAEEEAPMPRSRGKKGKRSF